LEKNMNGIRARLFNVGAVGLLMTVVACGGTDTSTAATPTTAPTTAPVPTVAPFVATRVGPVAGVNRTIFTDISGMTLYYETNDVGGKINCTGPCAAIWPPMIAPAGLTTLPAVFAIPGKFATAVNPDGKNQVTYNGWPLFTYSKDKAAGDTTGEGVAGRWHVASTDLAPGA